MPRRNFGTIATTTPTLNPHTNLTAATGIVPDEGRVMVQVSGACILTIRVWSNVSLTWVTPGSSSSDYQKTFAEAGMDFFAAPPGARFHIHSDTGSITGYISTDAIPTPLM
jgi:hypothetical protein